MKILMLDIETAPHKVYTWGLWDQNIGINQIVEPGYTLCWAAKWYNKKKMHFASVVGGNEKGMLEEVHDLISEADAVVHYNGTKFDMPTLNKEFLQESMPPPAPYHQIDLLRTMRQQFRLPSNKLDYVAQFLGLGSKVSHKGMPLWTGCMNGDPASWKTMEKYNKGDVILLERVYDRIKPWIKGHPNHALYKDIGEPVCISCGSDHLQFRGEAHTKTMSYRRIQCMSCHAWMRQRTNCLSKDKKEHILVGIA